jgi:insertion element IS1 protein InsB
MRSFFNLKSYWSHLALVTFTQMALGAYERHIEAQKHEIGKQNMQKIESKHINL